MAIAKLTPRGRSVLVCSLQMAMTWTHLGRCPRLPLKALPLSELSLVSRVCEFGYDHSRQWLLLAM
jgi:hypothetical protein